VPFEKLVEATLRDLFYNVFEQIAFQSKGLMNNLLKRFLNASTMPFPLFSRAF